MAYTDKWLTRVVLNPNAEGEEMRAHAVLVEGELAPVADGEYYCDVDVKLSSNEIKELRASRNRASGDEMVFLSRFIFKQLHAWNVDGPDGILPVTEANVALLDREDSSRLVTTISAGRRQKRSPQEETDFS